MVCHNVSSKCYDFTTPKKKFSTCFTNVYLRYHASPSIYYEIPHESIWLGLNVYQSYTFYCVCVCFMVVWFISLTKTLLCQQNIYKLLLKAKHFVFYFQIQDSQHPAILYMHRQHQGPVSIWRPSYLRMAISMLKIRRPLGRLIFNMGITIPGKTIFLIETAPMSLLDNNH